jgi:hypothetical protein
VLCLQVDDYIELYTPPKSNRQKIDKLFRHPTGRGTGVSKRKPQLVIS